MLCILVAASSGCAGVYLSHAVNVPALRTAGQTRVSASTTIFSPVSGTHVNASVAATSLLRLAGSFGFALGGGMREGLTGQLLVGAEVPINRIMQWGLLGGMGYGRVVQQHSACDGGFSEGYCVVPYGYANHVEASYVQSTLQGYVVVSAPKVVDAAFGMRMSVLAMRFHTIDHEPSDQGGAPVSLEPFALARVGGARFRVGPEVRYVGLVNQPRFAGRRLVVPDQFVMGFGLSVLLGPLKERPPPPRPLE